MDVEFRTTVARVVMKTRFGSFLLLEREREIGRMDRRALTLLSVQLSTQQPGSNEAGSHWNSHSVLLQQITESWTKTREGGEGKVVYIRMSCM